jgi:hypothetical protein
VAVPLPPHPHSPRHLREVSNPPAFFTNSSLARSFHEVKPVLLEA